MQMFKISTSNWIAKFTVYTVFMIFINNKFTIEHVPKEILLDPKVKVYCSPDDDKRIGTIKNRAFNLATGDVLKGATAAAGAAA